MFRQFAPRSALFRSGLRVAGYRHAAPLSMRPKRFFSSKEEIVYTMTDEAPALATYSLLPIIRGICSHGDISLRLGDISVAGRILSLFPERLKPEQVVSDELANLGKLCKTPEANVIKLPNISASVPQMVGCIKELQAAGYDIPDYVTDPTNDEERAIQQKYASVSGSAVNPVLREGNSDRRAATAVKQYAKKFPHSMGAWFPSSRTEVVYMKEGAFFHNEQSVTAPKATTVNIEHVGADGTVTTLKKDLALLDGEVLDSTFMCKKKLVAFYEKEIKAAKDADLLLSLHLKATMMKVSDPIMFGHCVKAFFKPLFDEHGDTLAKLGVNVNNGFGDVLSKIEKLPKEQKEAIEKSITYCYSTGPELAMVDSDNGITNLHVPSDVIVDASMPAMIRSSGQMWNNQGSTQDTLAMLPDETYAGIYETCVNFHRVHGAFDPTTMGSVPNVGLMAQKAQEYGSHDKTFEVPADGKMRVVDASGATLMEHNVEAGDIWRACQTKDLPIKDWVKLAVTRARATGAPAVFWLDENRAHDRQMIAKVEKYLKEHELEGLDIRIMAPKVAMRFSLIRMKAGQDTISVTGNVLRDYLTDLFPILELGTSAKMLSVVPLMNGGGMFETGAGGSAPKHVQQFNKEGHLRWDSLGEFLALGCALEHIASKGNVKAKTLYDTIEEANSKFLLHNRSPMRKVNQLDNRGSHFYFGLYWCKALAEQTQDPELAAHFSKVYAALDAKRGDIVSELKAAQGSSVFTGGYFMPDAKLAESAMRPSPTLNAIVDSMGKK